MNEYPILWTWIATASAGIERNAVRAAAAIREEVRLQVGIFERYVPTRLALLGAIELVLSFLLFYAALSSQGLMPASIASPDALRLAFVLAIAIAASAATIGLYQPHIWLDRPRLLRSAGAACLVAALVILVIAREFTPAIQTGRIALLAAVLAGWMAIALAIRLLAGRVAARLAFTRRIMILGDGPGAERVRGLLRSRRGRLFEAVSAGGDTDTFSFGTLRRQNIWGVITATDIAADQACQPVVGRLLDSKMRGIRVLDAVTFQERYLGRLDLDMIGGAWMLHADGFSTSRVSAALKRMLDVAGSLALMTLTLPVMLLTAVLIKLDTPGPALYRQERAGLHGVPFTLLKFRSMRVDAEANGTPRWAQARDPRITRVGAFIRMMRIDELPQLVNVLRGDMSLVGPRPERPHFVRQLERAIPLYHERTYVKPGITGWAQVNYPYGASIADAREKLAYDLYYVKNRGLLVDILILAATVRVVLCREGAR